LNDEEAGMNNLNQFESMARKARQDAPPALDVSRHVIYRIAALDESIDRPLAWLTVGSLAAASFTGAFALSMITTLTDPMSTLFHITPLLGQ
jgi:hypothetical protein